MAKLYFNYSSMNAGKTTVLLQSAHNYRERGMTPKLFTPKLDDRYGTGWIKSRIGLQARATIFTLEDDLYEATRAHLEEQTVHCVLAVKPSLHTTWVGFRALVVAKDNAFWGPGRGETRRTRNMRAP